MSRIFGCSFLIIVAAVLASCGLVGSTDTQHHRITVVVETPGGEVSGSSVIESTVSKFPSPLPEAPGIKYEVVGEAVWVDMPDGQTLLALLDREKGSDPAAYHANLLTEAVKHTPALRAEFGEALILEWFKFRQETGRRRLSVDLPLEDYPALVTFGDPTDPTSLEMVDPRNLAATFGPGVALKRITVSVTDDPVTTGIGKRLPWLGHLSGMGLTPAQFPDEILVAYLERMFRKEPV